MDFDICETMTANRPKVPKELQPNPILRRLGILSPSRCFRYDHYEYDMKFRMWLCYHRKLDKNGWKWLYRHKRMERQPLGGEE